MLSTRSFVATRAFASTAAARANGLVEFAKAELEGIHEAGTYKAERFITSPQGAEITVKGTGNSVLNFCANNYLGLSADPRVMKAAHDGLEKYGVGLSSVRFICGTQAVHKDLEGKISKFHGMEDTILFPSCFDANAGLFETILTADDAVISDQLNHASIIDGIRLCKAQRHRYNHLDMGHLEEILQETQSCKKRLIATDGVFSMDGDIAPLDKICDLADKYNAIVFVDECHATGFFGRTGRGTDEYHGVQGRIDIINSTLGKALGGASGGYTTGRREVIDLLRNRARPYLFSNTISPPLVSSACTVFDILSASTELRDRLALNTERFRKNMKAAGFTIAGHDDCPIAPVMIGDARMATEMADSLLKEGIYVIGFSYPVVPKGQARIRVQLSAAHTFDHIDHAVDAFTRIGKNSGLLK